ncbi:MAG TPA: hypothetical protein VM733_00315 [Thermoanaerobaculia bacterium]|nr:hypothetical protein [Thermoanaerobaculia bacterium]
MRRALVTAFLVVMTASAVAQEHMSVVRSSYGDDANKFPLNPQWKCQRDNKCPGIPLRPDADDLCDHIPVPPKCATSFGLDQPTGFKHMICSFEGASKIHGHINFTPATFYGRIEWEGRSPDFDFNFALTPARGNGSTKGKTSIHSEFDSRETLRQFLELAGWWGDINSAVPDEEEVGKLIDSKTANAVITGLFGLDCEHDCAPELHPIYLMGLRAPRKLTAPEHWAVLARSSGNEGYCSSKRHALDVEDLRLLLPNRVAKVVGTPKFYGTRKNMTPPVVTPVPGVGVLIAFRTAGRDVILGELDMERSPTQGIGSFSLPKIAAKQKKMEEAAEAREERESAEGILERLMAGRPAVEEQTLRSFSAPNVELFEANEETLFELQPVVHEPITEAEYRALVAASPDARLAEAEDPEHEANDERIRHALCVAYNNNLPDARLKDACKP